MLPLQRPLSNRFNIVKIGLSGNIVADTPSCSWLVIVWLSGLAEDFVGNLGHMATLVARAFELVLARLAAAVEAGDGGGSVGRTTGDLTQLSQPSEAVRQADDHHTEMQ